MYINANTVYTHLFILYMSYLYQNGETALYVAAENNHKDIALLLIKHGCSVDVKNDVSSYKLQHQLTKPFAIVVHMFTYLQSNKLASTQMIGTYLLLINNLISIGGSKSILGLLAYQSLWNVREQTCPRLLQLKLCIFALTFLSHQMYE